MGKLIKLTKYNGSGSYKEILLNHEAITGAERSPDGDSWLILGSPYDTDTQIWVKESLDEIMTLIKETRA